MSTQIGRREWISRCVQSASIAALVPAVLRADDWAPKFLTQQQNATLVAMGEAILPGSGAAHCNRVIDGILLVESPKNQSDLKAALDAFSAFHSSSLEAASITGGPRHEQFELIKEWIADTYWSSEQGLKELGWNGQMAWASYPGCEHSGRFARRSE